MKKLLITLYKFSRISYKIIPLFLLTSCSEIGLLSEKNSWIVENINGVGDFLKVYIVLQISILLISLVLSIFLGKLGYVISLVAHFIWIVYERDYGFFYVLLLFGIFSIVSFLVKKLKRENKYLQP